MSITLSLDRDKANEAVKQALEMMETIDEYADEGSHIVATQKASGLGSGNAAKLTIKFWPDGDSTRIEYETKKGNPLDLTTDTDEIEEEFQRSVQQVSDSPSEDTEHRERKKEAESTSPTTLTDAVGEAAKKVDETVEQVKKERDSGVPVEDDSPSTVEQDEETAPSTSEGDTDTSDDEAHQSAPESSYCPSCGTAVSNADEYCPNCGNELSRDESSGTSEGFRERVNEELDEGEIDTDSEQSVSEQVSDVRGDESGVVESSNDTGDNRGIISKIVNTLGALILMGIGLWLLGRGLGLLMINPL